MLGVARPAQDGIPVYRGLLKDGLIGAPRAGRHPTRGGERALSRLGAAMVAEPVEHRRPSLTSVRNGSEIVSGLLR
jgi:hypothetical protein